MAIPSIIETYTHIVSSLSSHPAHSKLAYIHLVEPRVSGTTTIEIPAGHSNNFIRDIWLGDKATKEGRVLISTGGYTRELAIARADSEESRGRELIGFGRHFIANVRSFISLLLLFFTFIFYSQTCHSVSSITSFSHRTTARLSMSLAIRSGKATLITHLLISKEKLELEESCNLLYLSLVHLGIPVSLPIDTQTRHLVCKYLVM